MLAENILRDRNRASIIIWSVGNETPVSDARNAFLRTLVADARALDDSRLVSAALLERPRRTTSPDDRRSARRATSMCWRSTPTMAGTRADPLADLPAIHLAFDRTTSR